MHTKTGVEVGVGVSAGVARAKAMLSWRWIPIKGARKVATCMVVQAVKRD
jgi:hypothetical protein